MYTNKLITFFILMLMFGVCVEAFAQEKQYPQQPHRLRNSDEYGRVGSCMQGHNHVSGTTMEYVKTSTGTDDDNDKALLLQYGAIATISCDVATTFCMTHSTTATIATNGWIDDSSSEGNHSSDEGIGGCLNVLAGTYRDVVAWKSDFDPVHGNAVSIRKLSCEGTTAAMDNSIHGYPCDADGDCFYSGATCGATDSRGINIPPDGVHLLSIAAEASNCFICIER